MLILCRLEEKKLKTGVAVCTFNGSTFILDQLESIFHQTMKADIVCIYDDASTDDTFDKVVKFCEGKPSWNCLQRSKNVGYRKNFELSITETPCDLLFFSDQDDLWYPNKIETMVQYLKINPEVQLLFSKADTIDGNGKKLKDSTEKHFQINPHVKKCFNNTLDSFQFFLRRNVLTGATMVARRNNLRECIPFSPLLVHDHWIPLWLSAMDNKIAYISTSTMAYRIHSLQQLGVGSKKKGMTLREWWAQRNLVLQEILARLNGALLSNERKQVLKNLVENEKFLDRGHFYSLFLREAIRKQSRYIRIVLTIKFLLSGRYGRITSYRYYSKSKTILETIKYALRDAFYYL